MSEAESRKSQSIEKLLSEGVPVLESLPAIESTAESHRRSTLEVSHRAIALALVASCAEGIPAEEIESLLARFDAEPWLSPHERQFVFHSTRSDHDRVQFVWRYEAYWVLLWALSFVPDLGPPNAIVDAGAAVSVVAQRGTARFLSESALRSQDELLAEADLAYRYHWAVRNAQLKGTEAPEAVEPGIVMERHYALNWLVQGPDWDEVDTST